MAEYAYFTGTMILTVFLIVIFVDMSSYNTDVNCPDNTQQIRDHFNQTDYVGGTFLMFANFLNGQCSGLEWWVYLLIIILFIGDVVFLTPFVGG